MRRPQVIERVTVVGTGVIGSSWCAHYASRGLQVTATDPAAGAESRLRRRLPALVADIDRLGTAFGSGGITFTADLDLALTDTHFVQECGPERLTHKIDLIAAVDARVDPDVIIASSSRTGCATDIQSGCRHPERVVVGRPMNPPHLIPLVEVVGGDLTSEATITRATAFYAALGKRPIHPADDHAGSITDRLRDALYREALDIIEEDGATLADIDTAISEGCGLRWSLLGPFADLYLDAGAHTLLDTLDRVHATTPRPDPDLTRRLVRELDAELGGGHPLGWRRANDVLIDVLTAKIDRPATLDPP